MPLLNIYLQEGKNQTYIEAIRDTLHQTLIETWSIPKEDCFQIYHEIKPGHFFINPVMWDMNRTRDVIVIHITSAPRTKEMKLLFYQQLPLKLQSAIGLSPDDVFISIISNGMEDWSFGRGKAQLLEG